jgi:hypothetical protein
VYVQFAQTQPHILLDHGAGHIDHLVGFAEGTSMWGAASVSGRMSTVLHRCGRTMGTTATRKLGQLVQVPLAGAVPR